MASFSALTLFVGQQEGIRRIKNLAPAIPQWSFTGQHSGNLAAPGVISRKIGQLNKPKVVVVVVVVVVLLQKQRL